MGSRVAAIIAVLCLRVAPVSAQEGTVGAPPPVTGTAPTEAPARARGPTVMGVELRLPEGEERASLEELVEIRPGQPLSRRAARRTLERLLGTGRFADGVVHTVEVPDGVRVVIELVAQPKVTALEVEGNRVLTDDEVLEAARLELGQDYYAELLDGVVTAVEAAYRQRGYDDVRVRVEPSVHDAEVSLLLRVEEGVPTRVSEVTVAGSPGLPLPRLLAEVGIAVGAVLDRRALDAGLERLRALYRRERFYSARVGDPVELRGPGGAGVALPLSAGPRYSFHFHGNRRFPDAVLQGVLRYDGLEVLDEPTIGRLARRVEDFYRYHGFHVARVVPRQIVRPDGAEAVLAFVIEEGPVLRVERIEIEGNRELSTRELLEHVMLRILEREPEGHGGPRRVRDPLEIHGRTGTTPASEADEPEPEPGSVYIEEAYREAAEAMRETYRQRGFSRAEVRFAGASIDGEHRAQVRFTVDEGPRTLVRALSFEGSPPGFDPQAVAGVASGAPLSSGIVEESRTALLQALGRDGYLFARVSADTSITEDGTQADIRFRIEPGPQVRMGRVVFQGLERTDEDLVRATLKLRPGAVLDPQDLAEAQRSLVLLGIFRQVEVRLVESERTEPVKDVVIAVKERARLVGEVSGGYFLTDGPRLTGDVVLSNIGGQGVNVSARAKVNYVGASAQALRLGILQGLDGLGLRGNVAVHQPRLYALLPTAEVGARLDLIGERVIRQAASYRFDRFAAVAGLDWTARRWVTASLQYELEQVQVKLLSQREFQDLLISLARTDQERLRFPFGVFALQTLRPSIALDLRDDPVNPRSGLVLSFTAEVTRDLYTRQTEPNGEPLPEGSDTPEELPIFTLKIAGNVSAYLPLTQRVILAFSARGGRILPLDPSQSNTIAPKRFFLGGSTTLRGFREDAMIPEDRRDELHEEVTACRQLANPAGCSAAATALVKGLELPSQGGELFVLGKTELRFPVSRAFDMGIFVEAGNLWLSPDSFDPLALRYVAGAGIRYATPIGPLALDVGFNLLPDQVLNETQFNVNFSIGIF